MSDMSVKQLARNFYFDRTFNCDAAKIMPGEYYFSKNDIAIVTVLGSCVSACLRDTVTGVGGMNHFMLPESANGNNGLASPSMCYGNYAMEVLINELFKAGARRENLEAKVFGGGNVLRGMTAINIGKRNAEFALNYLHDENIKVVAEDLIDVYARKVYFFPRSGKVLVQKIMDVENDKIKQREREYAESLKKTAMSGGEVELF